MLNRKDSSFENPNSRDLFSVFLAKKRRRCLAAWSRPLGVGPAHHGRRHRCRTATTGLHAESRVSADPLREVRFSCRFRPYHFSAFRRRRSQFSAGTRIRPGISCSRQRSQSDKRSWGALQRRWKRSSIDLFHLTRWRSASPANPPHRAAARAARSGSSGCALALAASRPGPSATRSRLTECRV